MDLDATPGSATANSYVTVADASHFLEGRLSTEPWFGIQDETEPVSVAKRETALIWATQLLDEQVRWHGQPSTTTQALAWPQTGQVDRRGVPIPSTIVPADIQQATAFYALALLAEENTGGAGPSEAGIKSKKLGDLTIVYQDQVRAPALSPTQGMPAEIRAMVRPYAALAGSFTIPLVRV